MQDNQQPTQFYNQPQANPYAATEQVPKMQESNEEYSISWTASEFIYHEKNSLWYVGLAAATATVSLLGFLLLGRDWYTLVIIMMLGVLFGVAASRKPRVLQYVVDDYGLIVDQKHYGYEMFKSFSVNEDNPIASLVFIPSKRFGAGLTIYVPEENLDEVTNLLSIYLPMEKHDSSFADSFLNKIKF